MQIFILLFFFLFVILFFLSRFFFFWLLIHSRRQLWIGGPPCDSSWNKYVPVLFRVNTNYWFFYYCVKIINYQMFRELNF